MVGALAYFITGFFIDNGVQNTVDNLNIKNEMTDEEIEEKLNNKFQNAQNYEIKLTANKRNKVFKFSDISVNFDLESSIETYRKYNGDLDDVNFKYDYDEKKLDEILNSFQEETCEKSTDIKIEEKETFVLLSKGDNGQELNMDKIKSDIKENISFLKKAELEVSIEDLEFEYDLEKVYENIYKEPIDATVESTTDGYNIVPHELGIDIDKKILEDNLEKFKTSDEDIEIEISILTPEITTELLEGKIFQDTISSFSTNFSSSTEARATNVSIAASKINGSIIAPGETFSYNSRVGQATTAAGFKEAPEYSNGKVVMGVGGGICQVSSTLHNAVLRNPDAKIASRNNHSFTVSYVESGYDAAVSYGYLDYKFVNDSKWPIKINAVTSGRTLTISIIGTKDNNKVVSLSTKKIKDIPYQTVYEEDNTLSESVEEVQNNPKDGLVVETYRTITEDGQTLSSGRIYTSTYKAYDKVILKGTKKDTTKESNSEESTDTNDDSNESVESNETSEN
jgi:vancomycin resistance protein YoaR